MERDRDTDTPMESQPTLSRAPHSRKEVVFALILHEHRLYTDIICNAHALDDDEDDGLLQNLPKTEMMTLLQCMER